MSKPERSSTSAPRRLHVLIVPAWYPSLENPGAGSFVRDQARAVAQRHRVTVVAPPCNTPLREAADQGIQVLQLPRLGGSGRVAALARLAAMSAVVARLRWEGRRPDLVHAHVFAMGFLGVLVASLWRLPVVVSEHDSDILEERVKGWDARIARFTYRRASLVCPVSSQLECSILRLEPHTRSEVIPNVVDVDSFAAVALPRRSGRACRVLAVTAFTRTKGVAHLIGALRLLASERPDVTTEVVGDGPDREMMESLSKGLAVTFSGLLPREDVITRFREADALVVPSVVETFGIVALEGLAAGLPVVVTDAHPFADLVSAHGGRVVPPADPVALADALATVLARPNEVPSTTAEELRKLFGPEAIAEQWDAVYRSVLGTRVV